MLGNNQFTFKSLNERFLHYISPEPNSGCWLWTGGGADYGSFGMKVNGKASSRLAHVVSYELHVGPVPDGLELDHKCRVHCCVNPDHLEPVTHRENMRRGIGVGAVASAIERGRTHCPKGHAYTDENTYVDKAGSRVCRACHREYHAAYQRTERGKQWKREWLQRRRLKQASTL